MGLGGGNEAVSLAMMGMTAGTNSALTVLDNGGSVEQATLTGIVAGAAEAYFEKAPILELGKMLKSGSRGFKNSMKRILAQAFDEGKEEVLTDIANEISDFVINGDKSDFMTTFNGFKADGYSDFTAIMKTCGVFGLQMGVDFLAGASAGGIMAGGAINIGNVALNAEAKRTGAVIKEAGNVNVLQG